MSLREKEIRNGGPVYQKLYSCDGMKWFKGRSVVLTELGRYTQHPRVYILITASLDELIPQKEDTKVMETATTRKLIGTGATAQALSTK